MIVHEYDDSARLQRNAALYRYDARLDKIADLMDSGDVEAWQRLPLRLQGEAAVHRDLRAAHRAAVEAGAVADDRGPGAP